MQASSISTHPLSKHPLYPRCKAKLCHSGALPMPSRLDFTDDLRENLARAEGEGEGFRFQAKGGKGVVEMMITVLAFNEPILFEVTQSSGLQVAVSPIRYAEYPQLIVKAHLTGDTLEPPVATIKAKSGASVQVQLPLFMNRFIGRVELTREKYEQFYQEFSSDNKAYQKLDWFRKLEEGPGEFLKKLGAMLTSVCGMKVTPHPSMQSMTGLWACGQTTIKGQSIPIVLEGESYPQEKGWVRLSGRSGSAALLVALYQLV